MTNLFWNESSKEEPQATGVISPPNPGTFQLLNKHFTWTFVDEKHNVMVGMEIFVQRIYTLKSEKAEAEHGEVNTGFFPQLRPQHLQRTPITKLRCI